VPVTQIWMSYLTQIKPLHLSLGEKSSPQSKALNSKDDPTSEGMNPKVCLGRNMFDESESLDVFLRLVLFISRTK